MEFPKLYKIDNKGKIRIWSIDAYPTDQEGGGNPYYQQIHGVLGGKLQYTFTNVKLGKNTGKANETTAWEQCKLEAESLWKKQRDRKGYSEEIPTKKPFGPMLAKSYDKDGKHIKFPCYVQPKLDGLRCIARVENGNVTLWSRQNKQFKILKHIEDELSKWPNGIYDGELYTHKSTFQEIVGAIKRDEANELTSTIEYHIYDIVDEKTFQIQRLKFLSLYTRKYKWNFIKAVDTKQALNEHEVKLWHKHYTKNGFEGVMLRNRQGMYKIGGRSADLQKYKIFMDQEFKIIGAEENKGKLQGTCVFLCETEDGGIFKVMPEGSEELRRQYWQDWNSGKIKPGLELTVKFFSWTTSTPKVPRFPIGIAIREGY